MTAHAGRGNEAAISVSFKLAPIHVRTILFLALPNFAGCSGAVEGTIKICGDYLPIVINITIQGWTLSPGNARVGNENVQPTVELCNDLIDSFLDLVCIRNIDLVCSASIHKTISFVPSIARWLPYTSHRIPLQSLWRGRALSCYYDTI